MVVWFKNAYRHVCITYFHFYISTYAHSCLAEIRRKKSWIMSGWNVTRMEWNGWVRSLSSCWIVQQPITLQCCDSRVEEYQGEGAPQSAARSPVPRGAALFKVEALFTCLPSDSLHQGGCTLPYTLEALHPPTRLVRSPLFVLTVCITKSIRRNKGKKAYGVLKCEEQNDKILQWNCK